MRGHVNERVIKYHCWSREKLQPIPYELQLPSQQSVLDQLLQYRFPFGAADGNMMYANGYIIPFDAFQLISRHNIGFMRTNEPGGRQMGFYTVKGKISDVLLTRRIYCYVILQCFHKQYIVVQNLYQLVIC